MTNAVLINVNIDSNPSRKGTHAYTLSLADSEASFPQDDTCSDGGEDQASGVRTSGNRSSM